MPPRQGGLHAKSPVSRRTRKRDCGEYKRSDTNDRLSRPADAALDAAQRQRRPGAGVVKACRHQAEAGLQKLVDEGRGDVPLIHLPFGCRCGSRRTGIVCSSKYGGRPAWNRDGG